MSGIRRIYRINNSARSLDFFLDRDPDDPRFDMDQPYQRGVVWGLKRKQNLIKSVLMGVPIPAILINNRFDAKFSHPDYSRDRCWAYAIVDGKQRVSTFQQFVANRFPVPLEWFQDMGRGPIFYGQLSLANQRHVRNNSIPVAEGFFKTLEEEQELFDLINFGGLAQGETDEDLDEEQL